MRENMNEKDDDQWLAALAGKSDPQASEATNRQAALLRQAMLKRRAELENETANAEPSEFARLQKRLEAEGLISRADVTHSGVNAKGFMAWLGNVFPGKNGGVAALPVWSLAVNCALVVVVAVQFMSPSQDPYESNVLRGEEGTILRVADPETRLAELIIGLDAEKVRYVVQRSPDGVLTVLVQADDAALDFLINQRIEAVMKDGIFIIYLKSSKAL